MAESEAIKKYNKLANNEQTCYPEEAQQLAEWLEELKELKSGTVIKNGEYPYFNGFKEGKEVGYSKAIDDFKEELFKNSERTRIVGWLGYSEIVTCEKIYEIAEQLKAGDIK